MMKVGLLLPRSDVYPSIAADLTVALRLCLKQQGKEEAVQLVSENIGFGGSDKDVYSKAEKLLLTESVDLLIAYIDMKVMPILEPLIFVSGKLLIVLNAGANYPEKKIPQPGIIYLTQQHSFLCSLTGKAAGDARGIYATTFYDCGYMHGAAMLTAFEKNNGSIIYNHVNRSLYDDSFSVKELTDFLDTQEEKECHLLCIQDEKPAALFYRALDKYEHADKLQLYVSPRMLTEAAIGEGGYRFSIEGYSGWLPEAGDPANNIFTKLYSKKEPTEFSLSGWQAGLVLNELLELSTFPDSGEDAVNNLMERPLFSPGGTLSLDPGTGFYRTEKLYHYNLPAGAATPVLSQREATLKEWEEYLGGQNDLPSSGWTNTYLCY